MYKKFMAMFPRLVLHARADGGRNLLEIWSMRRKQLMKSPAIPGLTGILKAMIPGFKWTEWEREMEETRQLRLRRDRNKGTYDRNGVTQDQKDTLARKFWERKGKPTGGKKIITGVQWGQGKTETNGKWGWDKVIRKRVIGVFPTRRDDGHLFLQISIPD